MEHHWQEEDSSIQSPPDSSNVRYGAYDADIISSYDDIENG